MEEMLLIKGAEMFVSKWSGGDTREIYIYPENSSYAEKSFIFRFSTAFVQDEKSTFTNLPGVQRELMLVDGHMKLYRNHDLFAELEPLDKCSFSGEENVTSEGIGRDVNLMLREGRKGELSAYRIEKGKEFAVQFNAPNTGMKILYLTKGQGTFAYGNEKILAQAGDALKITSGRGDFSADEDSVLIEAEVYGIRGI